MHILIRLLFIWPFLFLTIPTQAVVKLSVSLVHKKSIDKTLVLKSEFHEVVELLEQQSTIIKINPRLQFELRTREFELAENQWLIEIFASYNGADVALKKKIEGIKILARPGEKAFLTFKDTPESALELALIPEVGQKFDGE